MAEVILVAGLPGCGKTTHLCEMSREGWKVFDDFKANAFDHCSAFRKSRQFNVLVSALRDGLNCAVADVDFCDAGARDEAQHVLSEECPGVEVTWVFFEKDIAACEANIKNRNRTSRDEDMKKLREYATFYDIPQFARKLRIISSAHGPDEGVSTEN